MKKWLLPVGLFLMFVPHGASAQDKPGEKTSDAVEADKVVVTATITEKTIEEAPGSVEVLTAREIKETGAATVAEALDWAVGLVVRSDTGRASVPSIRGTSNKQTLVLIDGRRLALGYKDFVDTNQIPVTMIDRIEIVRGPTSALYGSDALGGVVNIITRQAPDRTVARAVGRFGSRMDGDGDHYLGSAYAGTGQGRLGVLLSGEYRYKEGWDADGLTPDDGDLERLGSAAGRFSLDLADDHTLSAGFEYGNMDREGDRFYQNLDRERQAEDVRRNYYVQYDGEFESARRFMFRAYRSEHKNTIAFSPSTQLTDEEDAERYLNQAEARFITPLFGRNVLTMGAELREEGRTDRSGRDDDLHNTSVYAQDEMQIFDPLYFVLGVRYDHHSEFGDNWAPRASLIYSVLKNFRIKASYGTGFRAPSISELFVTSYRKKGKWIYEPNPDLDPEESQSVELGVQGEFGPFRGAVTGFYNDIDNLIEAVFIRSKGSGGSKKQYYQYQNIAEAETRGVEIEAGVKLPLHFNLGGSLTFLETENKQTGEDLEGQPETKGILRLGYDHPALGIHANIRWLYIGEQYYVDGNQKAYDIWSFYVSKDLGKYVNLFGGIDNLFDTGEARDGVTLVEPVSYYAGVTINY